MIDPISLAIAALAGSLAMLPFVGRKKTDRPEKRDPNSLAGAVFAASITEPNGTPTRLEGEVEQCILSRGAECVPVNRQAVRESLKGLDVFDQLDLTGADIVIAGTLLRSRTEQRDKATGQTKDFVAWARQRHSNAYFQGYGYEGMYEDEVFYRNVKGGWKAVCSQYREETGQEPIQTFEVVASVRIDLSVDFRCFTRDGRIVGAGTLESYCSEGGDLGVLRSFARQIVERIHVRELRDGELGIQIGQGPIVPRRRVAESATTQAEAAEAVIQPPRPEDDRPGRTTRLDE